MVFIKSGTIIVICRDELWYVWYLLLEYSKTFPTDTTIINIIAVCCATSFLFMALKQCENKTIYISVGSNRVAVLPPTWVCGTHSLCNKFNNNSWQQILQSLGTWLKVVTCFHLRVSVRKNGYLPMVRQEIKFTMLW